MLPEPEHILQQAAQIIKKSWVPVMSQVWEEHRQFVDAYLQIARRDFGILSANIQKDPDIIKVEYAKHLTTLLENYSRPDRKPDFDGRFDSFTTEASRWAGYFQHSVRDLQPETALVCGESDNWWIRNGKTIKRWWFQVSRLPWRLVNSISLFFGRSPSAIPPLYRQVPLRQMMQFFVSVKLPEELTSIIYIPLYHRIRKELDVLMAIDKILENQVSGKKDASASHEFHALSGQLKREKRFPFEELADMAVENTSGYLRQVLSKAGTLEMPTRTFDESRISKEHKRIIQYYHKVALDAHLRLIGKLDEWQTRISLLSLASHVEKGDKLARSAIQRLISDKYAPPLASIQDFLQSQLFVLEREKNSLWLKDFLHQLSIKISSELQGKLVPDAIQNFGDNDIVLVAQNFTALVGESAIHLPSSMEVIALPETENITITGKAVTEVQIRQLVETDYLPSILQTLGDENIKLSSALLQVREMVSEAGRIAEYNLETAESLADIHEEQSHARQIAIEGLGRAIARITEADILLTQTLQSLDDRLTFAVGEIQSKMESYLKPETLLDARTRILKVKALRHSEQFIEKARIQFKKVFRFVRAKAKLAYKGLSYYIQGIREYLGIEEQEPLVSPEISDFLAETQRAISRLPYVYQRLFVLSPLVDEYFFRGRKKEIDRISEAFANWQAGRYAPTVIIGETGSGITSLLNLYVKNHLADQPLFRYEVTRSVYREEDLCEMLGLAFAERPFSNTEEMLDWFNKLENRPVIILEGLQRLFLRTIHGFGAIRLFAELISATNKSVFWITSCNLYGWQYLDKTMRLSDFFGYIVELQSLAEQEVVDVILRRHVASGYNLRFELPESVKSDKKLVKLSGETDQQKYLKEKYFSALNSFARSNIAISMLLWLRSAREVKGSEITIALPKGLNASFIKTLSREKLFLLYALLLHDGLSDAQLASVLNFSSTKTRLLIIQLHDDGVIVMKNGYYSVNPLLYRQVVSTLRDVNLIH
ncbi:hypothetical protein BA6E_10517 [Bacteroidales bacterium 6E]|nr:hypothetical protein BA6E_10517 [Bacteroidales bacterium 6E]